MSELLLKKGQRFIRRDNSGHYVISGTDDKGQYYTEDDHGNRETYG